MSKSIEIDDVTENFGEEKHLIFGYTPTCGTCKVSERMLDIAIEILKLPVKKIDMNFHSKFSETHQIMSVPVLMLMNKDKEVKRLYAFRSVPYLLENLK